MDYQDTAFNIFIIISIIFLVFNPFFGIGKLIYRLIKFRKGDFDELERKAVFDSLGYGLLIILSFHFIQFIIGLFLNIGANPIVYKPYIQYGVQNTKEIIGFSENIEGIFVEGILVNCIYVFVQYKYGLIGKRRLLVPSIILILLVLQILFRIFGASIIYIG